MTAEKPDFTAEELFYIENIMDINASIGGDKMTKAIEIFTFTKCAGNEEHCKLLAEWILELGKAQIVAKSIRTKIENYRKALTGEKQ